MAPRLTASPSATSAQSLAVEGEPAKQGSIVIGLGSPHGDDQAGWLVADEISRRLGPAVVTRNLGTPIDLTLAIEGWSRAVIIDAIRTDRDTDRPRRWEWPSPEIALIRASGTHAIGLPESLQLATELKRIPGEVIVWGIPGRTFAAGSLIAAALQVAIPRLAGLIIERDLTPPVEGR